MDKLYVELITSPNDCFLKKGAKGYIHSYVRCADNLPYAVVVTDNEIDTVPISLLKPINNTVYEGENKEVFKSIKKVKEFLDSLPIEKIDRNSISIKQIPVNNRFGFEHIGEEFTITIKTF